MRVIDYRPDYMTFKERLLPWPGLSLKRWAKLILQWRRRRDAISRHAAFEEFSRRFMPLTKKVYATATELRQAPPVADAYIAGSDQVWNTFFHNGLDGAFYLDFGPSGTKRLSYAASFATKVLAPGSEAFVKQGLSRFDCLAVREQSGVALLEAMGFRGRVVLDPVFLLSKGDWNILATLPHDRTPFILVYDFMRSRKVKEVAMRLARLHGCKICSVGASRLGYADRCFVSIGPSDFLGLVRCARCVVGNSFHAVAFSLIYHRDFFVVEREDGLNDRMTDFLHRLGLSGRLMEAGVSDADLASPVDYKRVDTLLQPMVAASKDYLEENLKP